MSIICRLTKIFFSIILFFSLNLLGNEKKNHYLKNRIKEERKAAKERQILRDKRERESLEKWRRNQKEYAEKIKAKKKEAKKK